MVLVICLIFHVICSLSDAVKQITKKEGHIYRANKRTIHPLSTASDQPDLNRRNFATVKSDGVKKPNIPPWLGDVYGKLKHSAYSADDYVKRGDVSSAVRAEKRTIKIGNQVCGTLKDTKPGDTRWDDKRHVEEDTTKPNNDDEQVIGEVHNCCADHNMCPRQVPAKSTKFGFSNDIEYAIMSCKCDSAFRKCLKDMKSYTADAIGHLYFDALKIPCLTFYDEASPQRSLDMISVVPDIAIPHPKIGGAQVILKPNENMGDKKDFFYTHEQEGVADSKEKGRQSSHPQLVRRVQYPTPKLPAVTVQMVGKRNNTT